MTLSRRDLMRGLPAIPLFFTCGARAKSVAENLALPQGNRIAFTALRNDSVIGSHVLTFARDASGVTVTIDVSFKVGIGPIVLFRYRMQAIERWQGGQFLGLNSTTNHNGRALTVSARRQDAGVAITATGRAPYVAPANALPLTHWNRACMTQPIFNPETGETMAETVHATGRAPVPAGTGEGEHFVLTGTSEIEDWYDGALWVGLKARATDGSIIIYRAEANAP